MNRRILTTITLAALVAATVIATGGYFLRQQREPDRADVGDPELVARGRIVYQQSCAACHGARLEGQPNWRQPKEDGTLPAPPHDVTGHTWHHSDQMLFEVTKYGSASVAGAGFRSGMPVYADILSDGDIWAALAYIKSHWPPDIQAAQSARSGDTRR
ncbi:MAG: cytochrome c [Spirochaetaceae bacterium]|nr:cytochrome c [Spirochaetaceae bacterium]